MADENIEIGKLYDRLLADGYKIENDGKYELIRPKNMRILTEGVRYVRINALSRHKTSKHLMRITVSATEASRSVPFADITVTTDHICMVYDKDHFFQNKDAKSLQIGEYVSLYDEMIHKEIIGEIRDIQDLGVTSEYVYDVEVNDDMHSFYANNVLIHNSVFLNLQCVTDWMKREYALPDKIRDWQKKYRDQLWKDMSKFVDEEANGYVRDLANSFCHSNNQDVLTYELEYMSDTILIEGKKHYATRKLYDEGDPVDEIKVSGIELKKGNVPKNIKEFLWDCYNGAIIDGWTDADYQKYVGDLYGRFREFTIDQIAFWKGYNTARESSGFLQMAQTKAADGHTIGTTGIARAVTFFNQIVEKMGLGRKFEQIRIGDKVRFLYIDPNNKYRIDVMAFKDGQWPAEFDGLFKPDYRKMFDKLVMDPLKRYREACGFRTLDPSKQIAFDIFEL